MPARKSVSEEDLVDLHGKVVLVTGGNTGIGYATIQMLARKGAKVYMGARDEGRALEAIKQLQAENINDGSVHWLKLDLSDPRAAQRAAQEFLEKEKRLDIIGGSAPGPFKLDKDGLLDIMVCNHISHFALTDALLPLMKETAKEPGSDVRIINPTTFATRDAFNKDYGESVSGYLDTYGLANVLHIKALQNASCRVRPITCIAAHPGPVKTSAGRVLTSIPYVGGFLKRYVARLAFAAAGKEVVDKRENVPGCVYGPNCDHLARVELYETTEKIISELA
ncbi:hypothetical protein B0H13DRAFT_1998308 [Mycena leptocephala]|nr:hypothetical protein B0H13DRAFT_1998308 [Mycena leptocephala]